MAYLLVNIDTEEEGLFGACYPRDDWRLGHMAELPRLQEVFDRFGVRPTYQVTTPVVRDRVGSAFLQDFLEAGRCDIGGHLHPWATEPYAEPADAAHSMPCLLPLESVRRKLTTLTRQIRERFDIQPVAYRSGRYGSAAAHTPLLLKLGYRVETSVCPFISHAEYGGPDYFHAPLEPYWLGEHDMLERRPEGRLLCVPIGAGFNVRHFRLAGRIHEILRRRPFSRLRMIGVLYRLGVLRLIRLNPEMTSLDDLLRLCRAKMRRGDELFHITFHSSNIGVGGTPYVPTREARDAFLDRLRGVLDYLVNTCGVVPVTSREYYGIFRRSVGCEIDEGMGALAPGEDRNKTASDERAYVSMGS